MNGSWHLGKLAGIDVRIHWTFLLLPAWIYLSSLMAGSGMMAAITSVVFVLAIFGCVVLHELGHALAARNYGIATKDITLLPIGGLARLERMTRNPWQEMVIALAGPAVNVVIAVALFAGLAFTSISFATTPLFGFLTQLAWVNVGLVVFNMIPAFPMDGGRILRSALAMFLPYGRATEVAATVGRIASVGFGLLGLLSGNLMLVVIAVFIYFAATGETIQANQPQYVAMGRPGMKPTRSTGSHYVINERTQPVLDAEMSAEQAARWISNLPGDDFPVQDGHTIVGAVSRGDLLQAIVAGAGHLPIRSLLSMRYVNRSPRGLARLNHQSTKT